MTTPAPDGPAVLELGDEVLVTATGCIDLGAGEAFRRCLVDVVRLGKPVLLDLTGVTFMDGRAYRAVRATSPPDGSGPPVTVITGSGLIAAVLQSSPGSRVQVRMS